VYEAVPGRKFERCSIVAGKCGKDILAPFGYYGTCNSRLFLMWVKEMLVPNLKKNQIVIMDNASIHKSPKIREAIEKAGCKLVYQPPYSPDLNPIEHFWSHLKQKIRALYQFPNDIATIFGIMGKVKIQVRDGSLQRRFTR